MFIIVAATMCANIKKNFFSKILCVLYVWHVCAYRDLIHVHEICLSVNASLIHY